MPRRGSLLAFARELPVTSRRTSPSGETRSLLRSVDSLSARFGPCPPIHLRSGMEFFSFAVGWRISTICMGFDYLGFR